MSDRKLAVMGILAVLMAGWAVLQTRLSRPQKPQSIEISPLIEGMDLDAIQGIRITSEKGQKTVTLLRKDGTFVVAEKEEYPADMKKVNHVITGCLDLRTATDSWITDNPVNHADLGVTPQTARYQIDFLAQDGGVIVGLLLSESKTEERDSTSYARLADENDVFAVRDVPWFSTGEMEYIDTALLEIKSEEVIRLTVTDPNGTQFTLIRPEDKDEILLEKMPQGKRFKGSMYRSLFNALSYFRMNDVVSEEKALPDLAFNRLYECLLKNQVLYGVRIARQDDKAFVVLSAEYTGPLPSVQTQVETEEQLKDREQKFLARDQAEQFTKRHAGWVYEIATYKADEMTRSLEELLEPLPAPEPEQSDNSAKSAVSAEQPPAESESSL